MDENFKQWLSAGEDEAASENARDAQVQTDEIRVSEMARDAAVQAGSIADVEANDGKGSGTKDTRDQTVGDGSLADSDALMEIIEVSEADTVTSDASSQQDEDDSSSSSSSAESDESEPPFPADNVGSGSFQMKYRYDLSLFSVQSGL